TELRLQKGMIGQYVAEKVGVNESHMNEIENGKQNPTYRVLQAIADLHHVKLSKLIALAEKKYEKRSSLAPTLRPRRAHRDQRRIVIDLDPHRHLLAPIE